MVKKEKKQRSMKSIWGFEDNYIMVPRLLLRNARKLRLKSNHLQLILAVMDHKWDERLPFLSVETLSRETGWSTRQVRRGRRPRQEEGRRPRRGGRGRRAQGQAAATAAVPRARQAEPANEGRW
jgi:hypothetical protein